MADSNINTVSAAPSNAERPEMGRKLEDKRSNENLKHSADTASAVDAIGGVVEGVENVDGRVAETLGEDQKKMGDSVKGGSAPAAIDPAAIRAQILKSMPTEDVMRKQVSHEIKKEIKYLHKKAMKMMRSPAEISYFEMSNLMRKLRELRGLLSALLKASLENIKTLWLRFVHGVM